jgi:hypothetical protein
MEPAAPRAFPPAEAGALLIVLTALTIGVGTLVGWAAGSLRGGLIGGAVTGVPVGIAGVWARYRSYFS